MDRVFTVSTDAGDVDVTFRAGEILAEDFELALSECVHMGRALPASTVALLALTLGGTLGKVYTSPRSQAVASLATYADDYTAVDHAPVDPSMLARIGAMVAAQCVNDCLAPVDPPTIPAPPVALAIAEGEAWNA